MENHFLINVAKKRRPEDQYGIHFFAAKVRDESEAKEVYKELIDRFHPNEYNITVTRWEASGRNVNWSE